VSLSPLVLRCAPADLDTATGDCSAPYWETDIGLLPPLSAADAIQIAAAVGGCWVLGFIVKQLRRIAT
jgi:hypothetical protein